MKIDYSGCLLATASADNRAMLWSIKTGKLIVTYYSHQDWVARGEEDGTGIKKGHALDVNSVTVRHKRARGVRAVS